MEIDLYLRTHCLQMKALIQCLIVFMRTVLVLRVSMSQYTVKITVI